MERRDALKLLAGAAMLPLLSRDTLAFFREVHEQLPATSALKTLNPHQDVTITTIAELIIPQTDTPGAKAARVNEFIDLILTEWYDEKERGRFLAGLAEKQQTEILRELDEELTVSRPVGAFDSRPRRRTEPPEGNFFFMMKQLTLVGYYTSEIGFEQELREEIIPPRHAGCVPIEDESNGR